MFKTHAFPLNPGYAIQSSMETDRTSPGTPAPLSLDHTKTSNHRTSHHHSSLFLLISLHSVQLGKDANMDAGFWRRWLEKSDPGCPICKLTLYILVRSADFFTHPKGLEGREIPTNNSHAMLSLACFLHLICSLVSYFPWIICSCGEILF